MGERCYLGIDVGTGSARAGIFDHEGRALGSGAHSIEMWRPEEDFVEQSSDDIWRACGAAVREALAVSGVDPARVAGIGFDATCSLVALDGEDRPVTVSPSGDDARNVVVWMDHRALDEARRINATRHAVLRYVGGAVSPEMQTPKLLWLQENLPETWRRTRRFFDLPDFLVYRATGEDLRSHCTTVCKWTYLGHEGEGGRWDEEFFRAAGLGELADEGFRRIGTRVRPAGERAGELNGEAAEELGLTAGTPVAVAIIDAHAGGLGLLGARLEGEEASAASLDRRLALIGGTSSCHMAVSPEPRFIDGVWGPYWSAMVPRMWLTEGGQSATGSLIDHVITSHARGADLEREARESGSSPHALLNRRIEGLGLAEPFPASLTRDLHVLPYFHGNRSPRADPTLRGAITGLRLSDTLDSLALIYLSTIQAVAYGTRHIIEALNAEGYAIDTLLACGGGTRNPLFLREHADATGCRIVLPREPEAVLLGSAILGAVASGDHAEVTSAMAAMSGAREIIEPAGGAVRDYHDRKYRVFHRMYEDQRAHRRLMGG